MSQCPQCAQEIEIQPNQYGSLYTCPHCTAVFFVDWEGQPERTEQFVPEQGFVGGESAEETPAAIPQNEVSENFAGESFGFPIPENPIDIENDSLNETPFLNEERLEEVDPADGPSTFESAIGEVIEFANSNEPSQLHSFQIFIQGLDLEQEVLRLKEILREPQFKFDVESLLKRISHGNLKITDVSSIKAAILVRRLEMEQFEVEVKQES